jgi:hypothetical protein|tara:strand:- start:345 stop:638 length:294 start_codon:yes stop_codon:yes gene_type:complete
MRNLGLFSLVLFIFFNNSSRARSLVRVAKLSLFYDKGQELPYKKVDSGFSVYPNFLNSEVNVESLVPEKRKATLDWSVSAYSGVDWIFYEGFRSQNT